LRGESGAFLRSSPWKNLAMSTLAVETNYTYDSKRKYGGERDACRSVP
jgi:hypothetical protein